MKAFSDHPLLERDTELAAIETTISLGADGSGGCLVFEGPAGIGKSRLLDHARGSARERGFRVLAARAGEREREYAWGVLRSLFEPVWRSADEEELEAHWSGPAACCRPLLEQGSAPAEGTPDSSFAIFSGFFHASRSMAAEQPLTLAVDDLHWVDKPSLGFLEFLARRIEEEPILIVTSLRPSEPGVDTALIASLVAEPHALRLYPQPLSPPGSAVALRARLRTEAGEELVQEAHAATGGNPLLLNELARTLDIESDSDAGSILPGTLIELGSKAIARTVEVRLERAGETGRRLAAAASVVGVDAPLALAVELAALSEEEADASALNLVRLEVLTPGSRVRFVHPLIRAAIYDRLAAPERARLHGRAARILRASGAPPERMAGHLLEVDPEGDPEVVATLRAAAVNAAAGGDSRSASLLMRRALAEPPPPGQLTDVLSQLGAAEILVDGPAAVEHLEAAVGRISEPAYRAAVTELLARALIFQERVPEAIRVCDRAIRALTETDDPLLTRRLRAVLVETTLIEPEQIGESPKRDASRLLLEAEEMEGDDYGSRAMLSLSAIAGARDLTLTAAEAADRARRAAAGGILIREGMNSIAQLGPSQALALGGYCAEAIELLDESLRWDERYGSVFGHLSNLIFRGRARLFAGELTAATADTEEALRLSRAYGLIPGVAWSTAILAETLLERGRIERAQAVLDAEVPPGQPAPRGWHWMNFSQARARVRLACGDAQGALEDAERAGAAYAANHGIGSTWVSWRPAAAAAAIALGRLEQAAELASEELALARRWEGPRQLGRALRLSATVDEGHREALLVEAVTLLEPSEARLELAKALIDLGAARRRANRKVESRESLRRGMDLAHSCAAEGLAERARSELRASGVRARRTALSGPESLTESERRTAELAAEGRTNREIAAELFVTVKTVEVHLSSAYRKLDVSGRRQLAGVMQPTA